MDNIDLLGCKHDNVFANITTVSNERVKTIWNEKGNGKAHTKKIKDEDSNDNDNDKNKNKDEDKNKNKKSDEAKDKNKDKDKDKGLCFCFDWLFFCFFLESLDYR